MCLFNGRHTSSVFYSSITKMLIKMIKLDPVLCTGSNLIRVLLERGVESILYIRICYLERTWTVCVQGVCAGAPMHSQQPGTRRVHACMVRSHLHMGTCMHACRCLCVFVHGPTNWCGDMGEGSGVEVLRHMHVCASEG